MTLRAHRVDDNGDWVIRSGKFVFVTEEEAASQIIAQTIKTQIGENQYNKTKGIDYFNNVFTGNTNFQKFEFEVRKQVKALSFVEKINSFEYTLENNILSYVMNVSTKYGEATVSA